MKKLIFAIIATIPLISFAQGVVPREKPESTGFLLISIVTIVIYIVMLTLKKKKILSLVLHKRILNIALLIFFAITAYTGIAFILWRDYGISIGETDGHITWGIIMTWIGIFHAIERKLFYTCMFKFKKKDSTNQENCETK